MVTIKSKGDFSKTTKYFTKTIKILKLKDIKLVADKCVERLKEATPRKSGLTADSWTYKIIRRQGSVNVQFFNTNNQNGVSIALLLDYGHLTKGGTWVSGQHFVDPAIKKSYDEILNSTWKELTRL